MAAADGRKEVLEIGVAGLAPRCRSVHPFGDHELDVAVAHRRRWDELSRLLDVRLPAWLRPGWGQWIARECVRRETMILACHLFNPFSVSLLRDQRTLARRSCHSGREYQRRTMGLS